MTLAAVSSSYNRTSILVAESTAEGTGDLTANRPAGTVPGDLIVALIGIVGAGAGVSNYDGAAGFSENSGGAGGFSNGKMWNRVVDGTDGATYTFPRDAGSAVARLVLVALRGGRPPSTSVFADEEGNTSLFGSGSAFAYSTVVGMVIAQSSALSTDVPVGWTALASGSGVSTLWRVVTRRYDTPGSVGSHSFTMGATDKYRVTGTARVRPA